MAKRDNKDLLGQIYFTDNYKNLRWHPIRMIKANNLYNDLVNRELDQYYNRLRNYPSDLQKETHRHTAASALLSQLYPENFVRELGDLKEYADIKSGQDPNNSVFDKKNNEIGISLGKRYPKYSHYEMYDEIMKQIRNDTTKDDYIRMPSVHAVIYSKN